MTGTWTVLIHPGSRAICGGWTGAVNGSRPGLRSDARAHVSRPPCAQLPPACRPAHPASHSVVAGCALHAAVNLLGLRANSRAVDYMSRLHLAEVLRHLQFLVGFMFYRIYAGIVTRLSVDHNQRDLPPIPCQVCPLL
jgi:hypothetical protein